MPGQRRPVALIVLDGWGLNPRSDGNAVAAAHTPNFDRIWRTYPTTTLTACGEAVGLLPGQMGDSNVGHLNLGAGRIVYQNLTRIHRAIADGSFFRLDAFQQALRRVQDTGGALHLMGLVSDGGVHSHSRHLFALIDLASRAGIGGERLLVHAFLDGRDVPPQSAQPYLADLEDHLRPTGGRIATVSGRYYAMDRDRRWERTELAFRALYLGQGETAPTSAAAVQAAYDRGETDEFVRPTVIGTAASRPGGLMLPGDAVIFFNFRSDRARQISRALWETHFDGFGRPAGFRTVDLFSMTQYDETLDIPHAFTALQVTHPLGELVAAAGLRQLRIAETEKYPHVTYFFNGGEEQVFPGEERVMVPSPKVATYDLQPEMSAYGVTEQAVDWIAEDKTDFMVLNFANPDMVGHTGVFAAAVRAVEVVDECLGRVLHAIRQRQGAALVLADHGNADQLIDYETGGPHTNHTLNPVPCVLVDDSRRGVRLRSGGVLANAAPTLCELIGIARAPEMDQDSLIIQEEMA